MRGVSVVALLLLVCGLPACSGEDAAVVSSPTTAAAESPPSTTEEQPGDERVVETVVTSVPGVGPCALATTTEVSSATGKIMNDGVPSVGDAGDVCEWISTESSASAEVRSPMKVTMTVGDLPPGAAQTLDDYASPGRGVRLDGLGDDAVIVCGLSADIGPGCDSYGPLIVIAGDRFVTVEMSSFAWPEDITQDQVRDGLETLARSALSRL